MPTFLACQMASLKASLRANADAALRLDARTTPRAEVAAAKQRRRALEAALAERSAELRALAMQVWGFLSFFGHVNGPLLPVTWHTVSVLIRAFCSLRNRRNPIRMTFYFA